MSWIGMRVPLANPWWLLSFENFKISEFMLNLSISEKLKWFFPLFGLLEFAWKFSCSIETSFELKFAEEDLWLLGVSECLLLTDKHSLDFRISFKSSYLGSLYISYKHCAGKISLSGSFCKDSMLTSNDRSIKCNCFRVWTGSDNPGRMRVSWMRKRSFRRRVDSRKKNGVSKIREIK